MFTNLQGMSIACKSLSYKGLSLVPPLRDNCLLSGSWDSWRSFNSQIDESWWRGSSGDLPGGPFIYDSKRSDRILAMAAELTGRR